MKCPKCGADLTKDGAVTITETETYRLQYSPVRKGVDMLYVSPNEVSTEVRCSECREELGLDLF